MYLEDAHIETGRVELLAILAHELRSPLAAIDLAVDLLEHPAAGVSVVEHTRAVIKRQLGRIFRLTDDLLDVARVGNGKLTLRKERVDLGELIRLTLESLRPVIDAGRHTLIVQLPSCGLQVDLDPMRFAQVLINLIDNAAKYSDRFGRITISAGLEGRDAVIRVRDVGIGISPETLPHVFDLFVQGEDVGARARGGIGVGLNLVQRIVNLHGGSVAAQSNGPGAGSEFTVRVPAGYSADGCSTIAGPTLASSSGHGRAHS